MSEWHVSQNGKQGPTMQEADLLEAIQAGRIGPDDQVWNTSMTTWQRVAEMPALAASLPGGPPMAGLGTMSYQMPHSGPLMFTDTAMQSLKGTKPWVRFMAVLMFIFAGLMVLVAVVMMIAGVASQSSAGPPALLGLVYIVMAAVYGLFGVLMNSYASKIAKVLTYRTEDYLEAAIDAQRKFWRVTGIAVIICLVLYFGGVALVVAFTALR